MFVMIEEHDLIVCETVKSKQYNQDIKIVWHEEADEYVVLWKRIRDEVPVNENVYTLMWKGSLDSCFKEFRDIVSDTFADSFIKD
jgi:hypothetical protein